MRRVLRPCSEPGCPNLSTEGKCATHRAAKRAADDAKRGNWRERGYDAAYDRNRRVVLREETICWLCGELVDKTLPGTESDGPSVDHVVRREDGGSNRRENLRLAHLRCNTGRRGDPVAAVPAPRREYRSGSPSVR